MNPVIYSNGTKNWFNEKGQLHRTDGPAIEGADGSKAWYLNGVLHRTDGPAIEYADGSKSWYLNGVLHRTDGPAMEYADGSKYWFKNGKQHRTDGPAYEDANGSKSWYLNGTKLSEDLFLKLTKGPVKKLPLYLGLGFDLFISERLQHLKGCNMNTVIYSNGTKSWYNIKNETIRRPIHETYRTC